MKLALPIFHILTVFSKKNTAYLQEYTANRYKLFYYFDEFLTKKKEISIYYDLLHKNKKIVDDDVYINTMAKSLNLPKNRQIFWNLCVMNYLR